MSATALAGTALLMGLAGSPHCATMCGAVCTALVGRRESNGPAVPQGAGAAAVLWMQPAAAAPLAVSRRLAALLAGRLVSYAALGALVAASIAALAAIGASSSPLRPFWAMLHLGAIVLGLWLLVTARQPAWMQEFTRRLSQWVAPAGAGAPGGAASSRRLAGVGLLWGAWPCGLLQSALVVAALGSSAAEGAAVMAAFALGSSIGLVAGPLLWQRLSGAGALGTPQAVTRLAGALLALASGWALWHLVAGVLDPVCR
jgi:uncharacterized protein